MVGPEETGSENLFKTPKLHSPLPHRFSGCLLHTSLGVTAVRKQMCPAIKDDKDITDPY